jgi:hypothetical protein
MFNTSFTNLSLNWARSIQPSTLHPTSWRTSFIISSNLRLRVASGIFSPPRIVNEGVQIRKYWSHLTAVHRGNTLRRNMLLFPPPQNQGKWSARFYVVKPVSKHLSNIRAAAEEAEPPNFRNKIIPNYGPLRKTWLYSRSYFYQLYRFIF